MKVDQQDLEEFNGWFAMMKSRVNEGGDRSGVGSGEDFLKSEMKDFVLVGEDEGARLIRGFEETPVVVDEGTSGSPITWGEKEDDKEDRRRH